MFHLTRELKYNIFIISIVVVVLFSLGFFFKGGPG